MNGRQEQNGHWHLRKEFTLGTIASLLTVFVGGYVDIKTDLHGLQAHMGMPAHPQSENRLDMLEQRMAAVDATSMAVNARLAEIQASLIRIEGRLNNGEGKKER